MMLVVVVIVSASRVARCWFRLCAAFRVIIAVSMRGHGATVCLKLTFLLRIRRGDKESVGVVGDARRFPRETAKCHATEYYCY